MRAGHAGTSRRRAMASRSVIRPAGFVSVSVRLAERLPSPLFPARKSKDATPGSTGPWWRRGPRCARKAPCARASPESLPDGGRDVPTREQRPSSSARPTPSLQTVVRWFGPALHASRASRTSKERPVSSAHVTARWWLPWSVPMSVRAGDRPSTITGSRVESLVRQRERLSRDHAHVGAGVQPVVEYGQVLTDDYAIHACLRLQRR